MSSITLIIPTYNRAVYLEKAMESLQSLVVPVGIDTEVLVINNNCTDHTSEVVSKMAGTLSIPVRQVIETQQGLCFGRNRGIAEARHEHLAFLDDDILVSPQWLTSYFDAMTNIGADAVVGPVFPIFEQGQPDFIFGLALDIISSGYSRKGDLIQLLDSPYSHELPGCNFGVKRSWAIQLSGFNTQLDRVGKGLLAGGDTDFGKRLVASGGRTVYHPGCWIKHVMVQEKLSKNYLRRRAYGLGATNRRLIQSSGGWWTRIRGGMGAGRLCISALFSHLIRNPEAFNRELIARMAWGQVWG